MSATGTTPSRYPRWAVPHPSGDPPPLPSPASAFTRSIRMSNQKGALQSFHLRLLCRWVSIRARRSTRIGSSQGCVETPLPASCATQVPITPEIATDKGTPHIRRLDVRHGQCRCRRRTLMCLLSSPLAPPAAVRIAFAPQRPRSGLPRRARPGPRRRAPRPAALVRRRRRHDGQHRCVLGGRGGHARTGGDVAGQHARGEAAQHHPRGQVRWRAPRPVGTLASILSPGQRLG